MYFGGDFQRVSISEIYHCSKRRRRDRCREGVHNLAHAQRVVPN